MAIHYHFIINEHAASGNAKKAADTVLALAKNQVKYTTHYSQYPGHVDKIMHGLLPHLVEFSKEAVEGDDEFPLIVVIGGDGTVHEVINALYPTHLHVPIAFIPSGSGNDFSRATKMEKDAEKAWQKIRATKEPRKVNVLTYDEAITKKSGVVVNNLGIGLDASIVNTANLSAGKTTLNKMHLGTFTYILGIVRHLFVQKGFPIIFEIGGEKYAFSKAFLCTTTNHPYFGGGVNIAPTADPFERNLDFVMVEKVAAWRLIRLIILLVQKKHLAAKDFHHYQGKELHLVSTVPQFAQLDGEIWQKQPYDITFKTAEGNFWF